ncbi:hypothetical protein Rhe02_97030 [Rhizocola hellebori]|uniref:Insecticide toxin TcdB middle/N-terminal domain-containing protein n=1 Tax=Rhizocola hellebori TaxID=1392758 RepID=A0A8J3VMR4_9ACTN|nr:RHS repeat-associated core domain-containing protein [Rhizocola hellebori]GIH11636.1 hypothetical protein Rhe02_97030 [Rhizocola hellebori]
MEVLDRSAAEAAGVDGLLLRLSRGDDGVSAGQAMIDLDYSGFVAAYGGDWAARLRLVAMPACAVSTPALEHCRRGVPVPSSKSDTTTLRLSAQVSVNPAESAAVSQQQSVASKSAADGTVAMADGPQLFGVQSGPGAYANTSLSSSAAWSAGTQAGDFSWSHPLTAPPVAGGLAPKLGLSYSSAMVDGRTAVEGAQTSQVGEGFADINAGFVERAYRSCADDVLQRVLLSTGWEVFTRMVPLADFDGDAAKRPDFLGITANGDMWINFNTSKPGDPSKGTGLFVSGGWGSISQLWPADLDNDGRTDLVGFDGSSVWWWRLTGAAGSAPTIGPGTQLTGFAGYGKIVPPIDVDRDGKVDIAGVNSAGEMRYRKNTSTSGAVSFSGTSTLITAGWGSVQHFFVGDFDGDGRVDITGRDSDVYYVWLLSGAVGSAPTVTVRTLGTGWGALTRFAPLLDYDRDGKPDIAGFSASGELYAHVNTSTPGNASRGWSGLISTGWSAVNTIFAADFDGDTVNDIVGRDVGGAMWVFQGTGKPGLPQFGPFHFNSTGDRCWRLPNATMSLGGKSVELILDDATGTWKSSDDSATKVEQIVDADGERWKATTADGTQYFFGLNKLPGWTSGDRETASRLMVPVFANHTGEACLNTADFAASWCQQPWRWNLDYVVDPHGNTMSYWYGKETNNTGLAGNPGVVASYDRASYLQRVEYGTRGGRESSPTATPPAKVVFDYADRCWGTCWNGSTPVAANWYDTPWDLRCITTSCSNNMSPSFWTALRLTSVTTQARNASTSSYQDVDKWELTHSYPATGDNTSPSLWLASVTHTAKAGTGPTITEPSIQFTGTAMQNRAHFDAGAVEPTYKYRLTSINNGTGGQTQVYYDNTDCPAGAANTPDPDHNSKRCYPQNVNGAWTWWSKYRVGKVVDSDLVGGSPPVTHAYAYSTAGSSASELWAHNDAGRHGAALASRTWNIWRGYSTVTITTGTVDGQKSHVSNLYMRGMHGDRVDGDNDGTRQATITTSDGVALQDDTYLAGFLRESITYDGPGGQPLTKTVQDPWWQQTSKRALTPTWAIPPTAVGGFQRTASATTKTWLPATSSWRTTQTKTTYDGVYGMPTQVEDLGDSAIATDDVCTRMTYARNTSAWIVDATSRVETVGVGCGQTASYPADLLSDTRSFFDSSTTFGTAPTRGLVTKVEQASAHNGTAPTYVTVGESGFDQWGRSVWVKDALGRQTSTVYTHDGAGRPTKVETTNPAGHKSTVNLEFSRGMPVTVVDANGKTTTSVYDTAGRLIKTWQPGNPTSGTPDIEYAFTVSGSAPNVVQTKVLGPNGNQIVSYELLDGFLRSRQTQSTAPDGKRTISDTQYDDRGLAVKAATFYNNASGPTSTLVSYNDNDVDSQTRMVYDGAARQTASQLWSKNVKQSQTSTKYEGDRIGIIPPAGASATQAIFDARGRVIEKRQYQSATGFTGAFDKTMFTADDAGRLVKAIDPAGNEWTYEYDLLGRTVKTTDPDAGTATSTYDTAGQRLSTTDSRGQKLFYEYDNLGRQTTLRADSAIGAIMATWVYDTIAKGMLTSTSRIDGANTYTSAIGSYDDGYRPLSTTDTIPGFGSAGGTLTYTVTNTYKLSGAPATQSVPSVAGLPAETLTYTYSDQGFANGLTSGQDTYIADASYTYDGQLATQLSGASGKQVRKSNTYDPATRRLTSNTVATETTPGVFTDKYSTDYSYDAAGNVLSTAGKTDNVADHQECFSYDYVGRLTEAWTQLSGACTTPQRTGADPYWRQWTFDALGNRLTQTDKDDVAGDTVWTYQIGAAAAVKPHQVKQVDAIGPKAGAATRTFEYDAAGNTTSRTTDIGAAQALTWDKEGHLATLTDSGVTTTYVYATSGQRLIAKNATESILYLSDGTELERIGTANPLGRRSYGAIAVRDASGLKWTCSDHQGTNVAQIDSITLTANRRRALPYGETRGTQPTWTGTKGHVGGTNDDTGLTHLGAREYDPSTGRFISVDPIMDLTDPRQWNAYGYANGSPVTNSDPSGLKPECGGGTGTYQCGNTVKKANGEGNFTGPDSSQTVLEGDALAQYDKILDQIREDNACQKDFWCRNASAVGMVAGVLAGAIVGGLCLAGSFGIAAVGCAAIGGFVGGAVGSLVTNSLDADHETGWQLAGEALLSGVIGAVAGAVTAVAGAAAFGASVAITSGLGLRAAAQMASGAVKSAFTAGGGGSAGAGLRGYADSLQNGYTSKGGPHVAAKFTSATGKSHFGHSGHGMAPREGGLLEIMLRSSGHHGGCAEVACLIAAETVGDDIVRGSMTAMRVRGVNSGGSAHGTPMTPCPSCLSLLDLLGIGY